MPFQSAKQRAFMYARHPDVAKRWTREYGAKIQPKAKHDKRQKMIKGYLDGR